MKTITQKLTYTLLIALAMTSISTFAQMNLALNKTTIGGFIGADTLVFTTDNQNDNANDGITNNIWQIPNSTDSAIFWQVDLGSQIAIDSIQIIWAYSSADSFSIDLSVDNINFTRVHTGSAGADDSTAYEFDTKTTRYVRINMYHNWAVGVYPSQLNEVEIYKKTGGIIKTNIALNKETIGGFIGADTLVFSSENPNPNANDGNSENLWKILKSENKEIFWQVDLEEEYSIDQLHITWAYSSADSFSIEFSIDSVNFTKVYTGCAPSSADEGYTFNASSARYVRINMYKSCLNDNYGSELSEVEIFEADIATPISINETEELILYPNPANTKFYIKSNNTSSVSIYNISGSLMQHLPTVTSSQSIDISTMPVGIYIVRTDNNTQQLLIAR